MPDSETVCGSCGTRQIDDRPALLQAHRYVRAMREQRRMAKTARWLVIWVVFTIVMRFVTGLTGIYRGWLNTAGTSASVVAFWSLVSWLRSRRERKATAS